MNNTINELINVLQDRKSQPNPNSYTSQLLTTGEDEILKKIGEEAIEVILAAKGQGNQRIIEETADLIYHLLVLLVSRDLTWEDIETELNNRRN